MAEGPKPAMRSRTVHGAAGDCGEQSLKDEGVRHRKLSHSNGGTQGSGPRTLPLRLPDLP